MPALRSSLRVDHVGHPMDDGITESSADDALFLERLDIYLEKSLDDLREFARREGRDFEQVRGVFA